MSNSHHLLLLIIISHVHNPLLLPATKNCLHKQLSCFRKCRLTRLAMVTSNITQPCSLFNIHGSCLMKNAQQQ